ncbi:hypothetical protein [Endozoicomonas sp. SESOKO1]|uniref:hypothetical protein n=1 Tax=Endozoicomonas sp. SESOKO1 TaxID=2828742 RepID=UPI0021485068|nr:hypothetical protein [Endozoicomonas sp. SESOKO1]
MTIPASTLTRPLTPDMPSENSIIVNGKSTAGKGQLKIEDVTHDPEYRNYPGLKPDSITFPEENVMPKKSLDQYSVLKVIKSVQLL